MCLLACSRSKTAAAKNSGTRKGVEVEELTKHPSQQKYDCLLRFTDGVMIIISLVHVYGYKGLRMSLLSNWTSKCCGPCCREA
mmetsp:Transcript_30127/g.73205  ORF Transcript_30127/g.73205 Transcript_30127/m.73205 type:complete len:83 (+) Transcript_30127:119-367(+)